MKIVSQTSINHKKGSLAKKSSLTYHGVASVPCKFVWNRTVIKISNKV